MRLQTQKHTEFRSNISPPPNSFCLPQPTTLEDRVLSSPQGSPRVGMVTTSLPLLDLVSPHSKDILVGLQPHPCWLLKVPLSWSEPQNSWPAGGVATPSQDSPKVSLQGSQDLILLPSPKHTKGKWQPLILQCRWYF